MGEIVLIYALLEPSTREVRYIGKTAGTLQHRLRCHIYNKSETNIHKRHWIEKLRREGLKPLIEVVEETTKDIWIERERFWIAHYRTQGTNLLNIDDGGAGGHSEISAEVRTRMSEAHKARYRENPEYLEQARASLRKIDRKDPALRAKISATWQAKFAAGYVQDPEARARSVEKRRRVKRGPLSTEHRVKLSKAAKGKPKGPMSDEAKAKKSATLKGKSTGPKSTEHRAKLSASLKGKPGRPHTLEEKARMSAIMKGRRTNPKPRDKCKVCGVFLRGDGNCPKGHGAS